MARCLAVCTWGSDKSRLWFPKLQKNSIWSWQRQKTFSWRHSQGDHMLVNPVSVVMPEWMLCLGMFCVILFGVCSPSVWHPVMSGVNPTQPAHRSHLYWLSPCRWARGAGPGRSRRSRTEGCLRRRQLPNNTGNLRGLSGTQTHAHIKWTPSLQRGQTHDSRACKLFRTLFSVLMCVQEYMLLLTSILQDQATLTSK